MSSGLQLRPLQYNPTILLSLYASSGKKNNSVLAIYVHVEREVSQNGHYTKVTERQRMSEPNVLQIGQCFPHMAVHKEHQERMQLMCISFQRNLMHAFQLRESIKQPYTVYISKQGELNTVPNVQFMAICVHAENVHAVSMCANGNQIHHQLFI